MKIGVFQLLSQDHHDFSPGKICEGSLFLDTGRPFLSR